MINIKNLIENIIYIIVIAIIVIINTYFVLKSQEKMIIKAIEKNNVEIRNEIKKIKNGRNSTNDIRLSNDSIQVSNKKNFIKKLFGGDK